MKISKRCLGLCAVLTVAFFLFLSTVQAAPPDTLPSVAHPKVKAAMAVQEEATPKLMAMENILGTAVGMDYDEEANLVIFVNLEGKNVADTVKSLPKKIKEFSVVVEITEPFRAMVGKPVRPPKVSHTAKQVPPIQLGTSGGWRYDLANGYCCGGTLGALIQMGGVRYILSNYHVFESDIVAGGNSRVAGSGDPVIQPGLIDAACAAGNAQDVATLAKRSSLPDSNVDASIAMINSGMVRTDGAILEIGTISSQVVDAFVKQAVKKSGRTTGLTRSSVSGLNATISVAYDNECAGGAAFTKTFTGQIILTNRASKFLDSGDSGSLMVEDVETNPKAIGLLFAGSSSFAVANPIGQVLSFFGATMVGN